jgi:hypothetical protein
MIMLIIQQMKMILLPRMLKHVQQCGTDFKPLSRYKIGGDLLDATYFSYYEEERDRLM